MVNKCSNRSKRLSFISNFARINKKNLISYMYKYLIDKNEYKYLLQN